MLFQRQVPFHSRIAYHYDALAGFMVGLFSGMVLSFTSVIARQLGASAMQMALIAISSSVGLLLTFLWTYIGMYGRKMSAFFWTKLIGRSLFFLMPFVNTPAFFVGIVTLYWFLESVGNPVYGAIMKAVYPDRDRARIMAYIRILMRAAMVIAAFMGGKLLDLWGSGSYKIVFPLGAAIGLLSLRSFIHIPLKEGIHRRPSISILQMLKGWFKDKTIWRLGAIVSVAGFGNFILVPIAPIFLVDNLKVSLSFVGLMGAIASIIAICSFFFWGKFIDRKGPITSLKIAFLAMACYPILYIVGTKWSVLAAAACSAFAVGGWELSWFKFISLRATTSEKVQIDAGFYYNLAGIRGAIGPFVGVWLMHMLGLRGTFFIGFCLMFTGFLLASTVGRRLEKEIA